MPATVARARYHRPARSTVMSSLPTVSESGVPGYEATIWLGLMAPKGTPKEIVDRLNAEIGRIIATPAIRDAWAKQGAVPMSMTPDQFGTFLKQDINKWARVIKSAGDRDPMKTVKILSGGAAPWAGRESATGLRGRDRLATVEGTFGAAGRECATSFWRRNPPT
jgi:hypothetical protein